MNQHHEIRVRIGMFTDPAAIDRLAACLDVLINHEQRNGSFAHARFFDALKASLTEYAGELSTAIDEVVADVTEVWFEQLDEGAIDDDL